MIATKEQERKALEKIRKIVAELGERSYVGTALEGCFEWAEENIENDFGNSPKEMLETAHENVEKYKAEAEEYKAKAEAERSRGDSINSAFEEQSRRWKESEARKDEQITSVTNTAMEYWNGWQTTKEQLEKAEQTIITLKAKLYDMMTA